MSFDQYGSIYFSNDLDQNTRVQPLRSYKTGIVKEYSEFSIGPSTGRELFDDMRHQEEFDKGPCQYAIDAG